MSVSMMIAAARALIADKKGVTAVEYGVIAALIIAVCAGAYGTLGGDLSGALGKLSEALAAAGGA